jgi:FKBP-type peptidyl-prolyl cis-trans isomerase
MNRKKTGFAILGIMLAAIVLAWLLFFNRGQTYIPEDKDFSRGDRNQNLEKVNQFLVEKDEERIRSFIKRRGWEMEQTGTGLWYQINRDQAGESIETGDFVKMNYAIRLLDGTLCYSSDSAGAKQFIAGQQESIVGLQEGIQKLSEGDKARFIIPPHLAYGLIGDEKKIPARAILVYSVHVLEVQKRSRE